MNDQNIARLEARLERLVEGAFANLFLKRIRAQDIALELARAMETGAQSARGSDPRPLAPDQYTISMHPDVQEHLIQRQPALLDILSQHMVELATDAGYRLTNAPVITILPDPDLETNRLRVKASHTNRPENSTAVMQRVNLEEENLPRNPQVIINGERTIHLGEPVINVGRSRDNQIIIDDPHVSRHHIQLRIRFGGYMLFDIYSHSGTFVNNVKIKEHYLQTGDVIRIGRTQLIYIQDDTQDNSDPDTTGIMDAVQDDLL